MIVPSKNKELLQDTEYVFVHPESFGVFLNADGSLTLSQFLESLLVFDRWCWLTIDDLEDTLFRSERFRISDGRVQYLGDVLPEPLESKLEAVPLEPYFPAAKVHTCDTEQQLTDNPPVRLYESLRVALLVSASRGESFENAVVMRIDTVQAAKNGISFTPLNHGIVLSAQVSQVFMKQVPESEIKALLDTLLYEIKFYETLFLEDTVYQADAARYLFQTKPQEVVETELFNHLTNSDRYVKMNILTALGLPAYSVGFIPGASLPPREERIEPVTLLPDTVRRILAWAETEEDLGVLDYIICAMKAQNYQGKLREISSEVRQVLRKIIPKLEDEQTSKDCKQLLRELPED